MRRVFIILSLLSMFAACDNREINTNLLIDVIDLCIPDCVNKECGDDGCGGSCGVCGSNMECNLGRCECKSGYGDCDNNKINGCESNLREDPAHCSACFINCGWNSVCNNGVCGCKKGYANCNENWADGCERIIDERYKWSKRLGSNGLIYIDYGQFITTDNMNNIYVVGYGDLFLSRLDGNGNIIWNRDLGKGRAGSVIVDKNDYVYLSGSPYDGVVRIGEERIKYGVFIVKFNKDGTILWSKNFDSNGKEEITSIISDAENNIFITGYFDGKSINFGGEDLINKDSCDSCYHLGDDIFVAKFDKDGNHIWSKSFGGEKSDLAEYSSLGIDMNGNIYLRVITYSPVIDFGGGEIEGNTKFLVKLDSKGNYIWAKRDTGGYIVTDINNNIYLVEKSDGIYFRRFNTDGNTLWEKYVDGDDLYFVTNDRGGYVYILGGSECCRKFIYRFDSRGNYVRRDLSLNNCYIYKFESMAMDTSDNVYLSGEYYGGIINFGGCDFLYNGGIFLVKYAF